MNMQGHSVTMILVFYIPDTEWSVITVADGAGSAIYSREGSRIAVDIVENNFLDI